MIGAAIKAALDAKRQVLAAAAPMLQAKPEDLEWKAGKVFLKSDPAKFIPFFQVAMKECGFIGTATEFAPKINPVTKKAPGEEQCGDVRRSGSGCGYGRRQIDRCRAGR